MPTTTELPSRYSPAEVEPNIRQRWADSRAFHADPAAPGEAYSIVIPPPNVTAALHMGHALNNTLQDILIRTHRMRGCATLWMAGTDHAGIATQTVVEKRVLQEEGKKRTDFERDEFIEKIQAWKDEYEKRITHQLVEMGCSCDWDRQRFTMDDICARAVREAFFQLFKDGLIYRGKRLVNWDPATQTALADDEVEMRDIDGQFYYLRYPLAGPALKDGSNYVTVATTRPETMLGDTAVAVNPSDPRAEELRGRFVILPIVNRIIPIVEDPYVVLPDAESADAKARYATGFLKVTPAHDPNDYEIGQRHDLPVINVMAPDGTISKDHGWPTEEWEDSWANDERSAGPNDAAFVLGKDRFEARKEIVRFFKDREMLEEMKPYRHAVGHSYRSHVPIEPYLSDQWYVKVTDDKLRGAALRAMAQRESPETSRARQQAENTQVTPNLHASSDDNLATQGASQPLPHGRGSSELAYLITFTTYGTWLHGDDRGSVDRDHNFPGTPVLPDDSQREREESKSLKHGPFSLDTVQRQIVQDAIREVCEHRGWRIHALHVRTNHVHTVVGAEDSPEKVMSDFKAYATRRLREADLVGADQSVWTRHGSTRYLNENASVDAACRYVIEDQGAALDPPPITPTSRARQQAEPPQKPSNLQDTSVESSDPQAAAQPLPHGRGSLSAPSYEGELHFHPPRYAKTFETWHENIRDWCISRQLWWGHRIPVWSCILSDDAGGRAEDLHDDGTLSPELNQTLKDYARLFDLTECSGELSLRPERDNIQTWINICTKGNRAEKAIDLINAAYSTNSGAALQEYGIDPTDELIKALDRVVINIESRYDRDPDVLDTWFSSALWPLSTMGWPDPTAFPDDIPEGEALLERFNPTSVLCTAREIITLWVSRMVMFNIYFRGCIPFKDVFIHAMIQDGEGQKMSKSLGNGVDPLDIIHSHGSDAMRFTLASMTTQTQDVRMPVDVVCPHTGQAFTPKLITASGGHKVAAPTQESPFAKGKHMVTSFGLSSGQATPDDETPLARNSSSKFDYGRNFANKLWNAARFVLTSLEAPLPDSTSTPANSQDAANSLADKWILSRLAETVRDVDSAIDQYEFARYAQLLYDFIWRDFCDWYIEAVKPVMSTSAAARQTIATVLDAILRLLHPVMPFITEKLWETLNEVMPQREVSGVENPASELLVTAAWPKVASSLIDADIDELFDRLQTVVSMIREVRTTNQVPPRETVEVSAKFPADVVERLRDNQGLVEILANVKVVAFGPDVEKPEGAAVVVRPLGEVYLHEQFDADAERVRLTRRLEEVSKSIKTFEGRLSNENYTKKAPEKLVNETRNQIELAKQELETIERRLEEL